MRAQLPLALAALTSFAAAQETYWVAATNGNAQVDAAGSLRQAVLPASTRDVGVAPDGKVWSIGPTLTILNPDGSFFARRSRARSRSMPTATSGSRTASDLRAASPGSTR
jgi:hypothetical protein